MTATGLHDPAAAGAVPAPQARAGRGLLRLVWLHGISRRVPITLALLLAVGALLWCALHWRWNMAGGAAALAAVSTYGPFGEAERATGRWLPYLRLGAAVLVTAVAFGFLAAGATGGQLPGGTGAVARNLAGMTGLGLLSAAALGGAFGWTGPMAYLLVTEIALTGHPTTPWVWAARPTSDLGAALCAAAVFVAGLAVVTTFEARDSRTRATE
jgi:hypothetical protein